MAAMASLKSSLLLPSPISDFSGAAVSFSTQKRRRSWQPRGARIQVSAAADSKNILVMGGTRFRCLPVQAPYQGGPSGCEWACSPMVGRSSGTLGFKSWCSHLFLGFSQDLTGAILSVVGDVPVDSEAPEVTSSISRISRLSLSEVLIGVGLRACIHRVECACVCERLRLYCISQKKKEGHQVTLFTRGKAPITQQLPGESDAEYAEFSSKVQHLKGDRMDFEFVKTSLAAKGYDVVYDINGREAVEVEPIIEALPNLEQYIYCSSAGVYLKSDLLPHCENDAVDPKSRHKGKLETESLLTSRGVNWTSIRPVYIYGPLNYNPVEEWFFHRLKAGRPIPIPGAGNQITQLGHVKDLATAFNLVLGNPKASQQIFNISGAKYVTFDGLARACAKAGGFPEPELVHYNPKDFDFGKKKAFPFRDQHFFASIEKARRELGWTPEFDLVEGLTDSYNLDFGRGTFRKAADFTTDDMILGKKLAAV